MAILFLDGFEMYSSVNGNNQYVGLSDVYTGGTSTSFDSSITVGNMASGTFLPGSIGSRAMISEASTAASNNAYYPVNNLTNICVGIHFKSTTNNSMIINLGNSNAWATNRIGIAVASSGLVSMYTWVSTAGPPANYHTTDIDPIVLNTWYYVELRIQVLGQAINAWLYKNGKLIGTLNNSLVLNSNAAFQNINRIAFGPPPSGQGGSSSLINYDNFYVTDGEVLGPIYIAPLLPSADTAQKDWGSTAITNYDQINELTGATIINRVVSTDVGDIDYYDHNPIPINDGIYNVLGVQSLVVYSTDSESTSEFTVNIDTGTSEVELDSISVPIGIDYNKQIKRGSLITTNPDTASQFQISELNNSKIGLERTN